MQIIKSAEGKPSLKLTKFDWETIGQKAGWLKIAEEELHECCMCHEKCKCTQATIDDAKEWICDGCYDNLEKHTSATKTNFKTVVATV